MNIADFLTASADRVPHQPSIRFENESISFQELNQKVDRAARGLNRLGLKAGDVCIVMMPNSIQWAIAYYALAKLGAVITPVNFLYKRGELSHIFSDSGARAFIGQSDYLSEPSLVLKSLPQIDILIAAGAGAPREFIPFEDVLAEPGEFPTHPTQPDDPWAIIYTSGTTGLPKGAVLTHQNLYSNAKTVSDMRSVDQSDVVLGVLPLFHIYGQTSFFNASIYLGLTIRMWVHFEPNQLLDSIEEETSTILFAVPTILNRLVELAQTRPIKRSSLKYCVSGGASLPVEVLRKFEEVFQTQIYEGYGLTECSPVCVENPYGLPTRPGSIGVPIPGFQARIVDDRDEDVPKGEVGELIVRGPGVMKEYLHQPEATATTLRGGWLHTGDLARMDEDNYIYIVDRKKELIIRGAYNVYPREIEEILYTHPLVSEAAVLGVPHPDLGEEVAAVVALKPGRSATSDEIRQYVKERVAPYKYPRIVSIVKELPKTSTGKILKRGIQISET